jgi:transposase
VKETSVCVVDDAGRVILEQKVPTEPADIIALLSSLGESYGRIGIEAGPLSQWLVNALTAADLPVICVETQHMSLLATLLLKGAATVQTAASDNQDQKV